MFIVHKNDTSADCLRSGILFEKFIVTFVKQFIDPTKNILDIGASIGTHAVIYSNYTNGNVFAFEPQKMCFDILNKNLELNNCNNVVAYNFGGSDENKKLYMNANYDKKDNHSAFSITENGELEIECRVIDELHIENVGYIKIYVQGHEYKTLLGLKQLILREKPTIMIEIHETSPLKNETLILLVELGYKTNIRMSHCDYIFFI
jgi:FkbM family methyltransferase